MATTAVVVRADDERARTTLTAGAGAVLLPRLISRGPRRAQVALVAGGALLLGGDRLAVEIDVGDDCLLELTEISGTVAYEAGAAGESSLRVDIRLGARATLLWMGLELVVADGAVTRRSLRLRMDDDAVALIRETTVLGRSGERGGAITTTSEVTAGDIPVLVESLELRGDRPVPGVVDHHRVIDTVLLAGRRPARSFGALDLEQPGALARYLGDATHDSPLPEVWNTWRDELLG